jgi:CheY-like chemotaxis protein
MEERSTRQTILIVDDTPDNIDILAGCCAATTRSEQHSTASERYAQHARRSPI